ncbi:hypothetical protein ACS0TY_014907 [Phlomoides rotata]
MAKEQVPGKRKGIPQKTPKSPNKTKGISKTTTTINTKNEDRNKIKETANDDAFSEETVDVVTPSSSLETKKDDLVESDEDVVEKRSSSDEDEEEEQETLKSMKEKSKSGGVKNKGKKRSTKEDGESEEEENNDNNLYRFPMNRVSRIIKSENPDIKITQEAVFVINKATERFLQVFCREAYACAFLDNKKYTAYNHLSSVVSRRKRLKFLSDFIPEKVKAEDALALISKE